MALYNALCGFLFGFVWFYTEADIDLSMVLFAYILLCAWFYISEYFGFGYNRSFVNLPDREDRSENYRQLENEFFDISISYPSNNFNISFGYSYPYSSYAIDPQTEKNKTTFKMYFLKKTAIWGEEA